eukprot:g2383.t1
MFWRLPTLCICTIYLRSAEVTHGMGGYFSAEENSEPTQQTAPAPDVGESEKKLDWLQSAVGKVIDTTNGKGPMPADFPQNDARYREVLQLTSKTPTAMQDAELVEWILQTAEKGNPQSVLDAIDKHCKQPGHWRMNVGPVKGKILDEELKRKRPKYTMEWGAYLGYSSIRMGAIVKQWGGKVVSLEMSSKRCAMAEKLVRHAGLADTITFVSGPVERCLYSLRDSLYGPFDLIFLDHNKDMYLSDLRVAESCGFVNPGTVLVADNAIFPAVRNTSSTSEMDETATPGSIFLPRWSMQIT